MLFRSKPVDQREDRSVSADAEGQREQRDKCEAGRLGQQANRETDVAEQVFEVAKLP